MSEFDDDTTAVDTGEEKGDKYTPEQRQLIVESFFKGEDMPEITKSEPDTPAAPAPETPKDEPAETPDDTPTTEPPVSDTVDVESLKRELETFKQRYENAARKITEQGMELGKYRAQPPQAPFQYQPQPQQQFQIQQPVTQEPFDFSDPNAVAALARREAERMFAEREAKSRAEQERERAQNWNSIVHAQKQRLSADLNIPEPVIDDHVAKLHADIASGNVPAIAFVWANRETIIQDAEKRGEQRAMDKFKAVQNQPKRAAASSSKTATGTAKPISEMSIEELREEIKTLPPHSPRTDEIAEAIFKIR